MPLTPTEKASEDNTTERVGSFLRVAFRKCIPKEKRKEIAREFPRPGTKAAQVPVADQTLVDFMGQNFPKKRDEQLSRIQASIIASCSPLADLWFGLDEQGFTGSDEELIPTSEVLRALQSSLALIGNATCYISQQRKTTIIEALPRSQANLAMILKQVGKQEHAGSKSALFGPEAMEEITKRVSTLESCRKAVSKVDDNKSKGKDCFLGKCSTGQYGARSSGTYQTSYTKGHTSNTTNKKVFRSGPQRGYSVRGRGSRKPYQSFSGKSQQ